MPAIRLAILALLVALTSGSSGGCVERTITVTSEPPGALVYLNDQEVGRTPVKVPFTFYGLYDVRMELDHYSPLITTKRAEPPWWDNPGPDLVSEAFPHKKINIDWHFTLVKEPPLDEPGIIDHAKQLRALLSQTTQPATQPAKN